MTKIVKCHQCHYKIEKKEWLYVIMRKRKGVPKTHQYKTVCKQCFRGGVIWEEAK